MTNFETLRKAILPIGKKLFTFKSKNKRKKTSIPLSYWNDMEYLSNLYGTKLRLVPKVRKNSLLGEYDFLCGKIGIERSFSDEKEKLKRLIKTTNEFISISKSILEEHKGLKIKEAEKILKGIKEESRMAKKQVKYHEKVLHAMKTRDMDIIFIKIFFHELAHRIQHKTFGVKYFKKYDEKYPKDILRIEREADRLAYFLWKEYVGKKISPKEFELHRAYKDEEK